MGDNSIKVNESRDQNAIPVATNRVGELHYPIYNMGYGSKGSAPTYVDENNPLPMGLYDGNGNAINSLSGALDVHIADVHNIPVNDYVHRHTTGTTLAAAASAGDTQITVVDTTDFIIGSFVHMGVITSTKEPIHPQVTTAPVGGVITLDHPIDFDYPIGSDVSVAIVDMVTDSVGATLADPIVYRYRPHDGSVEHIERLLFSMVHNTVADDSKFGGEAALLNGIVLRAYINGQYGTFTNWKTNADIKLDMFDVEYSDKAGGGKFGTNGRGSFNRIGVVIKLDSAQNDFIEFLIQDPQAVDSLKIKMQGHVEGG